MGHEEWSTSDVVPSTYNPKVMDAAKLTVARQRATVCRPHLRTEILINWL